MSMTYFGSIKWWRFLEKLSVFSKLTFATRTISSKCFITCTKITSISVRASGIVMTVVVANKTFINIWGHCKKSVQYTFSFPSPEISVKINFGLWPWSMLLTVSSIGPVVVDIMHAGFRYACTCMPHYRSSCVDHRWYCCHHVHCVCFFFKFFDL